MYREHDARRGLTLVEMLMAMSIMGIMASAMAYLSVSVEQSSVYNYGRSTAAQHARVTLDRINHMIQTATTAPSYPGAVVVYDQVGNYKYPDTLIVWHPTSGTPANPLGPPLVSECIFYCPSPSNPNQLVELTAPSNSSTLPLDSATLNVASWRATIYSIKAAASSHTTLLTDLLRPANMSSGSGTGGSSLRGAVRFNCDLHPTAAEWTSYKAGSLAWSNIAWPQGMYSTAGGLRQVWVSTELQLMPVQLLGQQDTTGQLPISFFGSTAMYYSVGP